MMPVAKIKAALTVMRKEWYENTFEFGKGPALLSLGNQNRRYWTTLSIVWKLRLNFAGIINLFFCFLPIPEVELAGQEKSLLPSLVQPILAPPSYISLIHNGILNGIEEVSRWLYCAYPYPPLLA